MKIAITFDTDWAPDWCIRLCFDLCREAGIGATFFATNPTLILKEIADDPHFEVGIHPNFFSNTTQILPDILPPQRQKILEDEMTRIAAVLEYCRRTVPNARAMRTHGLWRCSSVYVYIEECCPTIKYDVSNFIPSPHFVSPWTTRYSSKVHRPLIYIPYEWEDDISYLILKNYPYIKPGKAPFRIYNFHPIHVALNTYNMAIYNFFKKTYNIKNINGKEKIFYSRPRHTYGVKDILKKLIYTPAEYYTISELSKMF